MESASTLLCFKIFALTDISPVIRYVADSWPYLERFLDKTVISFLPSTTELGCQSAF